MPWVKGVFACMAHGHTHHTVLSCSCSRAEFQHPLPVSAPRMQAPHRVLVHQHPAGPVRADGIYVPAAAAGRLAHARVGGLRGQRQQQAPGQRTGAQRVRPAGQGGQGALIPRHAYHHTVPYHGSTPRKACGTALALTNVDQLPLPTSAFRRGAAPPHRTPTVAPSPHLSAITSCPLNAPIGRHLRAVYKS